MKLVTRFSLKTRELYICWYSFHPFSSCFLYLSSYCFLHLLILTAVTFPLVPKIWYDTLSKMVQDLMKWLCGILGDISGFHSKHDRCQSNLFEINYRVIKVILPPIKSQPIFGSPAGFSRQEMFWHGLVLPSSVSPKWTRNCCLNVHGPCLAVGIYRAQQRSESQKTKAKI